MNGKINYLYDSLRALVVAAVVVVVVVVEVDKMKEVQFGVRMYEAFNPVHS